MAHPRRPDVMRHQHEQAGDDDGRPARTRWRPGPCHGTNRCPATWGCLPGYPCSLAGIAPMRRAAGEGGRSTPIERQAVKLMPSCPPARPKSQRLPVPPRWRRAPPIPRRNRLGPRDPVGPWLRRPRVHSERIRAGRRLDRRPRRSDARGRHPRAGLAARGVRLGLGAGARPGGPAILRIDPATNEIIASVPLPGQRYQGFTVSDDAVWACVTGGVVRIDPETNAITDEVPFDTAQVWSRLAFGAGSVWAIGAGSDPNQLVRIDPAEMTATPFRSATAARAWPTLRRGLGHRIPGWARPADRPGHRGGDRARDRSRAAIHDRDRTGQPLGHPQRLGGCTADEPTVVRIDPADGSAVTEIATGVASLGKGGLWAKDGAVWSVPPTRSSRASIRRRTRSSRRSPAGGRCDRRLRIGVDHRRERAHDLPDGALIIPTRWWPAASS